MLRIPTAITLPDPMRLEGWEEQDEPLASDSHFDEQRYCYSALRYLLNPAGHYVSGDRWLRMDPANDRDRLLPDLLIALGLQERQWGRTSTRPGRSARRRRCWRSSSRPTR